MPLPLQDVAVWIVVFLISLTVHEAAHALAALAGGDRTAYHNGQVSLSPLPHMRQEPFGMAVFPILTLAVSGVPIGWASTPYDPLWAQRHPRRAAWMAAAGPGANLALVALCLLALHIGVEAGVYAPPDRATFSRLVVGATPLADNLGRFLSMLAVLNAILFAFNLIPFPPLDGASMVTLLMDEDTGLRFREVVQTGPMAFGGLIVAWLLFRYAVGPIFGGLLDVLHPGLYGP